MTVQRAKIFYWRTPLQIPENRQSFTFSELAWIHDSGFISQEGEGWTVVSNSVVTMIPDTNEILMATTMTLEVEGTIPDNP